MPLISSLLAVVAPPPPGLPALPHGPLARFLSDPTAWLRGFGHGAAQVGLLALHAAAAAAVVAVALAVVVAGVRVLLRTRNGEGSFVEVLIPPEVDPAGAVLAWRRLHAVLARRRMTLMSRPYVTFELAGSTAGVRVGLWAPPGVSAQALAKTVTAAWPGTMTAVGRPPGPLGPGRASGAGLRLSRPEWLPLGAEPGPDPLRGVLAELADCAEGDSAVVQVLARPASGRRMSRARRAAVALRTGRPISGPARWAEAWRTRPASSSAGADPVRAGEGRAVAAKAADSPGWEVTVRIGVAGPGAHRHDRARLRSRRRMLGEAFGFGGHNHLRPARLSRPGPALATRRMGRGQLLGTSELAALAHLPTEAMAGLSRAGAAPVAPPPAAFGDEDDYGL
jgi:hypothetical protein